MDNAIPFPALHRFLSAGGSIDVGRIDVLTYAAVACDADAVRVILDRRQGEALHELLQRLNDTLDHCLRSGEVVDEFASDVPALSADQAAASAA